MEHLKIRLLERLRAKSAAFSELGFKASGSSSEQTEYVYLSTCSRLTSGKMSIEVSCKPRQQISLDPYLGGVVTNTMWLSLRVRHCV